MTLKDYFLSLSKKDRQLFAEKSGTTVGQIIQIYTGNRSCSTALAINFDRESGGKVRCDELCPDVDFAYLMNKKAVA